MFGELDEALKQMLLREMQVKPSDVGIEFTVPNRKWSAKVTRPTLNLFLYDVRENLDLKDTVPFVRPEDERRVTQTKPPLRMDLAYMVTAWAGEVFDEHQLLARAAVAFMRNPTVPNDLLEEGVTAVGYPLYLRLLKPDDRVQPADLWNVLDNDLHPFLGLVVTVAVDTLEAWTGPAVRTKLIRVQPRGGPLDAQIVQVAGTVTRRTKPGQPSQPVAGATVVVRGTGLRVTTGLDGRFTFPEMGSGAYTLVVTPAGQKGKEKGITVPGTDYDVEV